MPTPPLACPLAYRGVLRVSGEDRRVFLQGLVSNDIERCAPNASLYAAFLTPQGKFLHDMFIYDAGDALLFDCEAGDRAEDLRKRLMAYKLRSRVALENVSEDYAVWAIFREAKSFSFPLVRARREGVEREGGATESQSLGLWMAPSPTPSHEGRGVFIAPDPRLPELGWRGVFPKNQPPDNVTLVDAEAYDLHRLALGVPEGSRDLIVEKSTLADGNIDLLNGISFTKGCYIGQELTARMHHRALVKKRLFTVTITGTAPPCGTPVTLNGEEVGAMRSHADACGLALLNIEPAQAAIRSGGAFASGTAQLTPREPSWLKS